MTLTMTSDQKEKLINLMQKRFRTFGAGDPDNHSEWNPISAALKDKPLQFAAGVDVGQVIDFILDFIEIEYVQV